MFRIYGKGETVSSSEYWDGRTKYNLLQKFIQGEYSSYIDLIDPIKEILSQNFETFDFLERFAESEVTKTGVFSNSLQNECIITSDDLITVDLNGVSKTYVRLSPGIIAFNGNIQIHKPSVELATKQLEQFLSLNKNDSEKVDIKYSYKTDSFKCRIYEKPNDKTPAIITEFCNGGDWDNDDSIGYTHGAQLLADMFNHVNYRNNFISSVGDDLTKINLELLVELKNDGDYVWSMTTDGMILLVPSVINEFSIASFTNTGGVISNINNNHSVYQSAGNAILDETGMIVFNSTEGIRLTDDSGSEVRIDANGDVSLNNGTVSIKLSNGDVVIAGNLDVQGTTTTLNTQSLLVSDNIIEVNKDQIGIPLSNLQSGLRINRGDLDDYYMLFDEGSTSFVVGTLTGLQSVATREDNPIDTSIPFWNNTTKRFETSTLLKWNGSKIDGNIDKIDGLHADDSNIENNDTTLATKNKIKLYVDTISDDIQTDLDNHKGNTGNPHAVTKAQVGLGNVPNWTGSTNVALGASNSVIPSQNAVKSYVDTKSATVQTNLTTHEGLTTNPHTVTKAQVGLGNVPNWSGSTNVALGTSDTVIPSQNAIKSYVDGLNATITNSLITHEGLTDNPHTVTKAQVELGNVPNWSSGGTTLGSGSTSFARESAVSTALSGKAASVHTHDDRYFTETEINTKLATKSDNHTHPYAASVHYHDDRYFTNSEITTKLATKSDTSHSHGELYYTETEMNTKLAAKSDNHTHPYAASVHSHTANTWTEVTGKPTTFTPSAHNQDWSTITGKPTTFTPSAHTHTWGEVTGKPLTFAPSAHNQDWSTITGKPTSFGEQFAVGVMMMYDGTNWVNNSTMPGWYACDGSYAGAPNLTNVFVMGKARATASSSGGANAVTLTSSNIPSHNHGVSNGTSSNTVSAWHTHSTVMGSHGHTWRENGNTGDGGDIADSGGQTATSIINSSGITATDLGTKVSGNPSANHYHSLTAYGGGGSHENRPAFYTIVYIRKCS